jgi:hypothetical protein
MAQRCFIMRGITGGMCMPPVECSGSLGLSSALFDSAVIPSPARACMPHHPGSGMIPGMTAEPCVTVRLGEKCPGVSPRERRHILRYNPENALTGITGMCSPGTSEGGRWAPAWMVVIHASSLAEHGDGAVIHTNNTDTSPHLPVFSPPSAGKPSVGAAATTDRPETRMGVCITGTPCRFRGSGQGRQRTTDVKPRSGAGLRGGLFVAVDVLKRRVAFLPPSVRETPSGQGSCPRTILHCPRIVGVSQAFWRGLPGARSR